MKMMFVGDVVLEDNTYEKKLVSDELYRLIIEQDIVCCNLEGPVETENMKPANKRGASIRNGSCTPKRLKESGFNMVTLANNHIMDYGCRGLYHTIQILQSDFWCLGAGMKDSEIYAIKKITIEGMVIGFISVAERQFGAGIDGSPGFAWMLNRRVWALFERAGRECDYFFVICHCGAEELMVPLPEVRDLYRAFIDAGATAVIGHHPHVIQGCENYKGKHIFYSLGNFAFDRKNNECLQNPVGLCVCIEINDGQVNFSPIVSEYKNNQVEICHKMDSWEKVNWLLDSEEEYIKCVEDFCVSSYKKNFRSYYAAVIGLNILDEKKIKEFAYHRLNGDKIKWDDLFIYHNVAIETNRWICEHAIKALGYLE